MHTVERLIFARTLLREFREVPSIRQNKTRQISCIRKQNARRDTPQI